MRIPIPEVQRQVAPTAAGGAPMARDVGMGGVMDAARSLQMAAQERERVAAQEAARIDQAEQEQAKARNIERLSAARLEWTQSLLDRQTKAGPEADNFTGSLLGEFDGWAEKSGQAIEGERERLQFRGMLAGLRDHLQTGALTFEHGARREYRKRVLDDGIDTDARTVMTDPGTVRDVLAARVAAIGTSTDLTSDQKAALTQKARETVGFNAAATLVTRDPAAWLQRDAATDPLATLIDPKQLRSLNEHARALVAQQQREAERRGEQGLKEAEKAVDGLREFALSGGLPDLAYQAQVRTLTRGTPYAEAAEALLQQSVAGAGFGSQSLARQKAWLEQAGIGGSPEQKKLIDHARGIYETQKRAFDDDPFAAAARFHRLPTVPEAQITDAGQAAPLVRQRLQALPAVETSAGRAVSPLRPAEAVQWAEKLQSLPPDARAAQLGEVGAMLNVGQVGALAEQLDKGNKPLAMSLKLGLDKTTAGRTTSALVLRGAQALADKAVKKDDAALTGWRSEIAGLVRGTLGDDKAEQDVIDAAYFVRAAMENEGTQVPGFNLKASNENAVRMVIGTPIDRGGVKTLTPRGMDEKTFNEKSRAALAPYSGAKLYLRGKEMTPQELALRIDGYGMKRDGQGRYTPVVNGAYVTTDADGAQPLRLEVR